MCLRIWPIRMLGVVSCVEYFRTNLSAISEEVAVIQGSLGSVQASKRSRNIASTSKVFGDKLLMSSMTSRHP